MTQTAPVSALKPQSFQEFRFGWKVIMAAGIGVGLGVTGANTYSLGVLLNPLSEEFGWSRIEASAAKTFLTLGYVVTAPFIGFLADKIGPRRIGLFSMFTLSLGMLCMTQMNGDIRIYYLAYFLLALTGCATTPLVWTRGVATWFHEKRGLALGLTLTGSGIAGIFTPPLISTLIDQYGWQAGYICMAAFAAIGIIPIFLFFFENETTEGTKEKRPAIPQSGFDLLPTLKSRRFWQISLSFMLIGGSVSALIVHLVPLLTDSGIPRQTAAAFAGFMGAAVLSSRVLTGYLVDRFHPPYVAGAFLILPAFGCMLLAAGPLSTPLILFAATTFGLAAGSEVDLIPYLTARYFGLKSYGKIYGWMFVLFYSGVGVGPLFLGWTYDQYGNYANGLFVVTPILVVAALTITLLGKPPEFK